MIGMSSRGGRIGLTSVLAWILLPFHVPFPPNRTTHDVPDDLGDLVAKTAGEIRGIPVTKLPTHTGVTAIYRI